MSRKVLKPILIVIALAIVVFTLLGIIPAILGMSIGYDAAMIEKTVQKNCQCEEVRYIKVNPNSETLLEDMKSGKLAENFSMQLINCDYSTLEELQESIATVLKENELCDSKNIQFFIDDFNNEKAQFQFDNCSLIPQ